MKQTKVRVDHNGLRVEQTPIVEAHLGQITNLPVRKICACRENTRCINRRSIRNSPGFPL